MNPINYMKEDIKLGSSESKDFYSNSTTFKLFYFLFSENSRAFLKDLTKRELKILAKKLDSLITLEKNDLPQLPSPDSKSDRAYTEGYITKTFEKFQRQVRLTERYKDDYDGVVGTGLVMCYLIHSILDLDKSKLGNKLRQQLFHTLRMMDRAGMLCNYIRDVDDTKVHTFVTSVYDPSNFHKNQNNASLYGIRREIYADGYQMEELVKRHQ